MVRKKEKGDGIEDLNEVVSKGGSSFDVLRLRGECYVKMKEYNKGVTDLKACLAMEADPVVATRIKEVLKEAEEAEKHTSSFFGAFHFHSPRKENRSFQYDVQCGRIKTEYEEACERLGVSVKDSVEEVRKRFHALALQYHPDKNPSKEAQDRFIELRKAYEYILQHHSIVCHKHIRKADYRSG